MTSKQWLLQTQNSCGLMLQAYWGQISSHTYRRTRIAVLDTGYDPAAEFFSNRDREVRLCGWRDWAFDSKSPTDEDGHGSRVLSLLMKMTPLADIYVARVAKNSNGLKSSSIALAEVSCDIELRVPKANRRLTGDLLGCR